MSGKPAKRTAASGTANSANNGSGSASDASHTQGTKQSFLEKLKSKSSMVELKTKILLVEGETIALAAQVKPEARNKQFMYEARALPIKTMDKFADKLGFNSDSNYVVAIKNLSTAPAWMYADSMRDHKMHDFVVETLDLPTAFTPLGDDDEVLNTLYEKMKEMAQPTEMGFHYTSPAPQEITVTVCRAHG